MSDSGGLIFILIIIGVFVLIMYAIIAVAGIALVVAAGYGLVRTVINYVIAFRDVIAMKQRGMPRIIPVIIPLAAVAVGGLLFYYARHPLLLDRRNTQVMEASKEKETLETSRETGREDWEEEEQEELVEYADVQINGVDQEYVQVSGTVVRDEQDMESLKLPEAVSVCAYDSEGKIVKREDIKGFEIVNDAEDYVHEEVMIEGKLSVKDTGGFQIDAVRIEVIGEAAVDETDPENHNYEIIVADVTWQEAYEDCRNRGGYLLQINSEEEFQSVIQMIEGEGKQNIHFYLGGRREETGNEYYWIDENDMLTGDMLNPESGTWMSSHWMENEPSFVSGDDQEMYMNLIYYQDRWVFNDVPMDITIYYPQKTGYICEFAE